MPAKESVRRYNFVHDDNSGQWKMTRAADGQYVPFIDFEKMKNERDLAVDAYNDLRQELNERDERESK